MNLFIIVSYQFANISLCRLKWSQTVTAYLFKSTNWRELIFALLRQGQQTEFTTKCMLTQRKPRRTWWKIFILHNIHSKVDATRACHSVMWTISSLLTHRWSSLRFRKEIDLTPQKGIFPHHHPQLKDPGIFTNVHLFASLFQDWFMRLRQPDARSQDRRNETTRRTGKSSSAPVCNSVVS